MLEDVVVAWDGSARSREALAWAVARPATRRVRLVRALGDAGTDGLIEVGPKMLLDHEVQQLRVRRPDLEVGGDVVHGDVEPVLMLESVQGSILALGTGGDAAASLPHRSAMLGRLAHRAAGPVALVPCGSGALAGPVVAGVDGTEAGVAAAQIAAAEAQAVGAPVILVHVRTSESAPPDWPDGPMDACARELAARYPHLLVRQRMVCGVVHEELLRSTESASLLVLGRHERSGPGSDVVEDALAGTSAVPVLIVSETDVLWPSRAGMAMSSTMRI